MYTKIKNFIKSYYKDNNKKRFFLQELEDYLIDSYKGKSVFEEKGGYSEMYGILTKMRDEGMIKEIKSSEYNGMLPPLKTKWEIVVEEKQFKWDQSEMLKLSDLIDFSYYEKHLEYQTDLEWEYIINIYNFLKKRENREWASCEERCLELFYDEKFLTDRKSKEKPSAGILNRLKLDYNQLKMKKYGEMFIYWNRGIKDVKRVIILENHSTFFSYKRICEEGKDIFGFSPDILIFGQGKKIINSFSFIQELADFKNLKVLYFGDIDPEGFGIYRGLKEKFQDVDISLELDAYVNLLKSSQRKYHCIGQRKNIKDLNFVVDEFCSSSLNEYAEKLIELWNNDARIPQELITYEYIVKL